MLSINSIINLLAQNKRSSWFIPAHREGIGRELGLVWMPSWLKNGEKKHWIAMHAGEDKSGLKSVYQMMQITPEYVKHGILKQKQVPMRSFVMHYYEGLAMMMGSAGITATDTTANSRSCTASGTTSLAGNAANEGSSLNLYGVVVGSSSTAVARTDNKLTTQYTHGVTAGTLQHGANSQNITSNPSGTISRDRIQRSFTGNASSTVNVQETGIYFKNWMGSAGSQVFCVEHNLNAVGAIAASAVLTVTKDLEITT